MSSPAPVVRAAHVRRTPEEAFAVFTEEIGAWWPLATHGLFGSQGSLGFTGGVLVERSLAGDEAVWAEVSTWEPPRRLVLQWHPGRADVEASEVEVLFAGDQHGTRVEVVHRGWERFGVDAERRRAAYAGPNAWGFVLDHYADLGDVHADREQRTAADLGSLRAAYDAFFAEAERGGFGPPPPGEWDAAQVVAHVALNDVAMAGVGRDLVSGRVPTFDNVLCQDRDVLAALVERCGDEAGLVSFARDQARTAVRVVSRLDDVQRETRVPCRLLHDGDVVVDQPLPWWEVAVVMQAGRHLVAHTGQLDELRVP